jgi:hypothetical protein
VLQRLTRPQGVLAVPDGAPRAAALVLSGSSGHVEEERCRLLSSYGVAALSLQWFGDTGQSPGICEIPLETFRPALDKLAALSPRLAVIGVSKGAEAALLLAARDPRIRLTVAMSPSSVVWANVGAGLDGVVSPYRSSWTWLGEPLPFVPYDDSWTPPPGDWPSYLGLYEQSLVAYADRVAAAEIAVEDIAGEVIVTAGGDDQVWPTNDFVAAIVRRRRATGLDTVVIENPRSGHRPVLPSEAASFGAVLARGGTPEADAEHGAEIWRVLSRALDLGQP